MGIQGLTPARRAGGMLFHTYYWTLIAGLLLAGKPRISAAAATEAGTDAATGSVTIVSNAHTYDCTLDGKPCSQDADGNILNVLEGKHVVALSVTGYSENLEVIEVTRGRNTRVVIPLRRITARAVDLRPPSTMLAVPGETRKPDGTRFVITAGVEPSFAYVLKGPPPDPMVSKKSFYLRRANLGFGAKVTPWVGVRIGFEYTQLELSKGIYQVGGPLLYAMTCPLRDAMVWLRFWGQELRLGQFRLPFGWESYVSSINLPVTNRSMMFGRLNAMIARDIGVSIVGKVPLRRGWVLEDGFSATNGLGVNQLNATGKLYLSSRMNLIYDKRFGFGFSGQTAHAIREGIVEETRNLGADMFLELPWLFAVAEGGYVFMSKPITTSQNGFFVLALSKLPWDIKLGGRFEYLDVDTHSPGNEKRVVGVLTYTLIDKGDTILDLLINYEHDLTWRMPEPWFASVLNTERIPPADTLRVGMRLRARGSR